MTTIEIDSAAVIRAEYVPIEGRLAYVERCGHGPAVLLVHTAGQSGVQYRDVINPLAAAGYEAVVIDLPGHGRSEPAADGPVTNLEVYATWLEQVIEQTAIEKPYVVGCSIGGKIVLDLATRMGNGIAGAVVMAADGKRGIGSENSLRRELEDSAAPSRSDRTYLGTLAVIGQSLPTDRREMIAAMHRREDPVISTSDLIGWSTHDLTEKLSTISAPVLFVAGRDDLWLNLNSVQWSAGQIAHANVTVLDGIGHYPMEEIPNFGDVLAGWLIELDTPDSPAERAARFPRP